MNLFIWISLGSLTGLLLSKLGKPNKKAVKNNILLGLVGALAGGILSSILGNVGLNDFNLHASVVAIFGSAFLY